MKFSAWYGILIGILMISQWTFSIVSSGVPEFRTAPWEIAFHLAAELSTALVLIIGGVTVLKASARAKEVLAVGLGMVIYSEIVSPGYYAQLGQWMFVLMFVAFLIGAVVSVAQLLKGKPMRQRKQE